MPITEIGCAGALTPSENISMTNTIVIMGMDNTIKLCGNMTLNGYTAGEELCKMPDFACPRDIVRIPVYLNAELAAFTIDNLGHVSLDTSATSGVLYTNGITYTVEDVYNNYDLTPQDTYLEKTGLYPYELEYTTSTEPTEDEVLLMWNDAIPFVVPPSTEETEDE